MNRKELVLAVLLKTFPAGSSLALKPESLELTSRTGDVGELENYRATLYWRDGIAQLVKVDGMVDLTSPTRWVAVMKQNGAGAPNLRLNDPDFRSRLNIAKQGQSLTFGRPLYVIHFELTNA